MNDGQPQEIQLADYCAPEFRTVDTHLEFDIQPGMTTVTNTMSVVRCVTHATSLRFDGEQLELVSVSVDGRDLSNNEYQVDAESLTINELGESNTICIVTRINPEENTALEGLYRSSSMYCTQCEAQGFRRITYYQDRPDVQAKFTTTITADATAYPTLLSNGNLVQEPVVTGGRKRVSWHDPFPKPAYLFALVAGDLQMIEDTFVTMSKREVILRIYSEAHNISQCHYAMDVLKRSMRWDERRFGREYDLDIFMIVAVEDFNMGAMENKGLNIFNTSCVLAGKDTATDAAYARVEAVVAHEYFHNWSGNRVTCRDWFQLSLKEGFTVFRDAEFSSDMNSRAVKRIEDVAFLRAVQFAEDAGPLAHPVRPKSYIEISNFYTTTIYEKGAEVVRMYQALLGAEKFRAGSDLYFARFDGSAATTDDFADVMAEVSGQDLTQFKLWYDQAGTPLLDVSETYGDGEFCLTIRQSCPSTPKQADKKPFHMPVELGLLDSGGTAISFYDLVIDGDVHTEPRENGDTLLISLRDEETTVKFSFLDAKPIVSFLRNFSAPVKVNYVREHNELAFLAENDNDGFVKWDALQTLWLHWFTDKDAIAGVDLIGLVGKLASQAKRLEADAEQKLLAATMLAVPEENYLFEQLETFAVEKLIDAREALLDELSSVHLQLWVDIYETYRSEGEYHPDAQGMANRALSNLGFTYAARAMRDEQLVEFVEQQYTSANNLTDRRAVLGVICNHSHLPAEARAKILDDFFGQWREEALVMDLWFSVQAQSSQTSLEQVEALEKHELFDLTNPNRVRSVYGAFGMYNHHQLHARDGAGYRLLTDAIDRIDRFNPQLAARLATPLTRWRRYDSHRQGLLKQNLESLLAAPGISKDLYEIVSKSLADD